MRQFRSRDVRRRLLARRRSGERGLSIIESLVVLLISSLLLAILLPTAIQSLSANLRIGDEGLRQLNRALDERTFRRIINAAVPARQASGARPVRLTARGDANKMSMTVLAREPVACAPAYREVSMTLMVVANEGGGGGRLVCQISDEQGGEGGEGGRVIAVWRAGVATFSYSIDGVLWRADWPDPELLAREENAISSATDLAGVTQPLVLAPLVRFEVTGGRGRMAWVERAGALEPVEMRPDGELRDLRRGAP